MLASTFFRRPGRADAPFRVRFRLFVILLSFACVVLRPRGFAAARGTKHGT